MVRAAAPQLQPRFSATSQERDTVVYFRDLTEDDVLLWLSRVEIFLEDADRRSPR
jgi:hypothetical protein